MATAFSAKGVSGGEAGLAGRVGSIDGRSRAARALSAETAYSSASKDMKWLEDNNPYQAASPAKTHIPSYLEAIRKGEYEEAIEDGDLCRPFNDRSKTLVHAVVTRTNVQSVHGARTQYHRSATPGGVDANALNSQSLTDFGSSLVFNSALAEIERHGSARESWPKPLE